MSAMSEIAVTIRAVNEATPEFEAISSDAANMGSNIAGSMGPAIAGMNEVGVAAAGMGADIASVSSEAVPALNDVGVAATDMRANVEEAALSFDDMSAHAEATMVSLRTVAGGIRSFGMMGMELTTVARDFGVLDAQTAKYMRGLMAVITIVSTAARMYSFLTLMTTGQTAAVAVEGTTETATAGSISLSAVAHNIYGAACEFATACENALNISHATFLALCGVGIGVIIAAAAAVAIFASQMNNATASVQNYNTAASKVPTVTKSIQRAQEQNMLRRGVE
jgi:hypothetical protein